MNTHKVDIYIPLLDHCTKLLITRGLGCLINTILADRSVGDRKAICLSELSELVCPEQTLSFTGKLMDLTAEIGLIEITFRSQGMNEDSSRELIKGSWVMLHPYHSLDDPEEPLKDQIARIVNGMSWGFERAVQKEKSSFCALISPTEPDTVIVAMEGDTTWTTINY